MLITAKMNREFGACYTDERLRKLYGDGKTPEQVATLRTGAWADVSTADRCWILWRVIATKNKAGMRECLARMVERVLPADCDPRSRAVIGALRENAVTDEIIAACAGAARAACGAAYEAAYTEDAARAARAARVAYEAVREAAIAAYAAARAAARAAYGAAYAAYAADAAAYAARAAYAAADAACAAYAADADAGTEMKAQIADILEFLF